MSEAEREWVGARKLAKMVEAETGIKWRTVQHWISKREENGLAPAVRRAGPRLLLVNVEAFHEWLENASE